MTKELKCYYCDEKATHKLDWGHICDRDGCLLDYGIENLGDELTDEDHEEYGEEEDKE